MTKTIFLVAAVFSLTPIAAMSDEWRFRSGWPGPAGGTLFLSESPSTTKGCEGKLNASEQILALGKWKFIRSLCYEVNKSAMVQFVDPEKMRFFNTFSMASDWFSRIPTKEELAAIAIQEGADKTTREFNELIRQNNEQINRNVQQRRPTICNHFGDTSICN